MAFAERKGHRIHFQCNVSAQSDGSEAPRPTVVMTHGLFIGNLASWWLAVSPALAPKFNTWAWDMPGHGLSAARPEGYDLDALADDVLALAPEGPLALVGHSYGALVSLHVAMRAPERVTHLVMADAPDPPATVGEISAFAELEPETMLDALPGPLRDAIMGGGRQGRRLLSRLALLTSETSLMDDLKAARSPSDAALASVTCPTLVVTGAESPCQDAAARFADRISGAGPVQTLPGGHYLPWESPRPLAGAILNHLTHHDGGR